MLSLASNILFMMRTKIGSAISNKEKETHANLSTQTNVVCCFMERQN